jgi:NDP-sugar pyrophosphorylase family protein
MQILIPMSGFGERFRRAGYEVPKPLIEVDGKAIIEYVVAMFPGETNFTFICNQEHLSNPSFRMREILERCCPTGRIIEIKPHKLGPVNAVLKISELINLDEPVIVNYCDFTGYWDYLEFKQYVASTACDGAIPCYTGFHPHLLRSVNFAYVKEIDGHVTNIQEKKPFTDMPMNEFASSGTYYFRSGALLLEYFEKSMHPDLALNGEFYVSMAYKPMLDDGLDILVFPIQHFMQWGTPEDLSEYKYYSKMFSLLMEYRGVAKHHGSVLVPMAGLGSRFAKSKYGQPKPLIPVSGKPMVIQAVADLPQGDRYIFILRRDLVGVGDITQALRDEFDQSRIVVIDKLTNGQASTCMEGIAELDVDLPLTIGACDNGAIYSAQNFENILDDSNTDVVIWVAREYPGAIANPTMYGWVDSDGDTVLNVSVKKPLSNPLVDPETDESIMSSMSIHV